MILAFPVGFAKGSKASRIVLRKIAFALDFYGIELAIRSRMRSTSAPAPVRQ